MMKRHGDSGFGAEYIAKRVADHFILRAFADGMKQTSDVTLNQTQNALQILRDIADGKSPQEM